MEIIVHISLVIFIISNLEKISKAIHALFSFC